MIKKRKLKTTRDTVRFAFLDDDDDDDADADDDAVRLFEENFFRMFRMRSVLNVIMIRNGMML